MLHIMHEVYTNGGFDPAQNLQQLTLARQYKNTNSFMEIASLVERPSMWDHKYKHICLFDPQQQQELLLARRGFHQLFKTNYSKRPESAASLNALKAICCVLEGCTALSLHMNWYSTCIPSTGIAMITPLPWETSSIWCKSHLWCGHQHIGFGDYYTPIARMRNCRGSKLNHRANPTIDSCCGASTSWAKCLS